MSIPISQAFKNEKKVRYIGPKTQDGSNLKWMKFEGGKVYTLRICPPWSDEGVYYRRIEQHHGFTTESDKGEMIKKAPICLHFIFDNEDIAEKLAKAGVITKADYEKFAKLGCPMCKVADALAEKANPKDEASLEEAKKEIRKFSPSTHWMINILERSKDKTIDGIPRVYSANKKFMQAIAEQEETRPYILDPKKGSDFRLKVEGEGFNRRYGLPSFYEEKTPINMAKGAKLNDLDKALAIGVMSFDKLVQLLRTNHTTGVKKSGINLNQYI